MLSLRNIGELVLAPPGPIGGRAMGRVDRLTNAAVLIEGGRIRWFGRDADFPPAPESRAERSDASPVRPRPEDKETLGCAQNDAAARTRYAEGRREIDAGGACVVPGLIDCHTHTVFAGTREHEFVARIRGKSYAQIANEGGGVRVTVEAVRRATEDELVELARPRLARMLQNGVTTVEIKSGYGLCVADEIKMLRAIRRLRDLQPVEIVPTYLAAHTTPAEFDGRADEYLDAVMADAVLQRIRDEKLAEFCDVFCERTAFDVAQSRRVLEQAQRYGLRPKVHADQITQMGASRLAAEVGAISTDHLEKVDEAGIAAMKSAGCVGVLLPGCSFFLGVEQAPARRLLDADLPVAIATDYNPGSSMMESFPLVMSIAATQMRMTPEEILAAATANAAAAVNRHDRLGAMAVGYQADLLILDVPNLDRWLYEPGRNCVRTVIKSGRVIEPQTKASLIRR